MNGRAMAMAWLILVSACTASSEIPEKLTKISSGIDYPMHRRFVAEGETFYLQTTRGVPDGLSRVREETDYRKFFSLDSKVEIATESIWPLQIMGAADSLFAYAYNDRENFSGAAYWPGQERIPLYQCNQGGSFSLYGAGDRPVIFLDSFGCNLGCDSLSQNRDAVVFVGDVATHTFHMSCAHDYGTPGNVVPIKKYFVFDGFDSVRVSQINANSELETVVERSKPDGVTQVYGVFEDDFSILASTGSGSTQESVEFNAFDGGLHPSRFELPTGFTVQRVFRPAPDKTFVYGWKNDARTNTIKRDPREAAWEMDVPVVNEERSEFDIAISTNAVVELQLVNLDAGTVDVWIQRFPY